MQRTGYQKTEAKKRVKVLDTAPLPFVLFASTLCFYFSRMALDVKEALAILQSGEWVALRFLTADVSKGTGGKVIELQKCRIVHKSNSGAEGRDPRHNFHFTRNVELQNKQMIKVHPILITHINQQAVL